VVIGMAAHTSPAIGAHEGTLCPPTRPAATCTKLSVVVPCHNAEPYVAQAIGSALEQTRVPDEIIAVDDGSSDGSLAILRRFEAAEPDRVRVASARLGRAARARNLGALLATGDALMFLDADDVLHPDALAGLSAALEQTPDGIALCPWFRLELVDGRWIERPPSCAPREPGRDPLDAWLTGWYHPPCSVLWSRTAFDAAGKWDEQSTVNDDGDLVMRALIYGTPLVDASRGRGYYRRLAGGQVSLSGTRLERRGLANRLRTLEKIAWLLRDRGVLDRHRDAMSVALHTVAHDALGEPDLHARALRLAREHRPPRARRAVRRALGVTRGAWGSLGGRRRALQADGGARSAQASAEPGSPIEVVWGLEHAARVSEAPLRPTAAASPARLRPAVSVVVPTYNRAHVITRTLQTVLAQTFNDVEVLVVDDGSTDDTEQVVRSCTDGRVHYLRQPANAGVSAARNRGLREARGEFIAFLDSDDEWMPRKLELQVALFRRVPEEVGLIYTGVETMRDDGTTTLERPQERGNVYREMLWRNVIHGGGSNVMIRREVVATVGYFHEGLAAIEDYEYWLRISRCFAVDFVDEPLMRYHDPRAGLRRSRALEANLEARWWLYRRHADEMRRAGVAHLFFLKTIRWAMGFPQVDLHAIRRLAVQAVREAPTSRMAWAMFARVALPGAAQVPWVRRHAALE
jgi:O-antigen biosynthesis protein